MGPILRRTPQLLSPLLIQRQSQQQNQLPSLPPSQRQNPPPNQRRNPPQSQRLNPPRNPLNQLNPLKSLPSPQSLQQSQLSQLNPQQSLLSPQSRHQSPLQSRRRSSRPL